MDAGSGPARVATKVPVKKPPFLRLRLLGSAAFQIDHQNPKRSGYRDGWDRKPLVLHEESIRRWNQTS